MVTTKHLRCRVKRTLESSRELREDGKCFEESGEKGGPMTHGMGQAGFGQGKAPHRDTPRIWGGYDHELNELINESSLATFQSSLGCWLLLSGEILELFHFLKEPFPSTLESHPSLGESKAVPFPTVTLEREFQEFTKGLGETPSLLGLDTRCQIFLPFVEPSDVASPPAFFFPGSHIL